MAFVLYTEECSDLTVIVLCSATVNNAIGGKLKIELSCF